MINKGILFILLITFLGCTAAPYQKISDTREILMSAEKFAKGPDDTLKYQIASNYLQEAEKSIDRKDYESAQKQAEQSKLLAEEILKHYYSKSNIKFEY